MVECMVDLLEQVKREYQSFCTTVRLWLPPLNRHQNLGSKEQTCSLSFLGHGPYWRRGEYEVFLQPLYTPIQHIHTLSAHLLAKPSHTTLVTALKPQFPLPFVGVLCCYIIIPVSTPADEGKRSIRQCTCNVWLPSIVFIYHFIINYFIHLWWYLTIIIMNKK